MEKLSVPEKMSLRPQFLEEQGEIGGGNLNSRNWKEN